MIVLRRLATVALAYAAAVVVVALCFVGYALTFGLAQDLLNLREIGFGIVVFGLFAAACALPVAGPMIAMTEWNCNGTVRHFIGAGAVLGIVLAILFAGGPLKGGNWPLAAVMLTCAMVGSLTYWLIAWRILPPKLVAHGDTVSS